VDDLDEDDLDLLEENTGPSKGLTRLRRGTSPSEEPRRKSRPSAAISDEDEDDLELPQVQDIHRIWDDERTGGREDDDDVDMDDMDNFIDYEDEEDGQEQMDEQERKRKRKEAKMMRAKAIRGTIPGVDAKCACLSPPNSSPLLILCQCIRRDTRGLW
jgi:transcription elongation factor SPT6